MVKCLNVKRDNFTYSIMENSLKLFETNIMYGRQIPEMI